MARMEVRMERMSIEYIDSFYLRRNVDLGRQGLPLRSFQGWVGLRHDLMPYVGRNVAEVGLFLKARPHLWTVTDSSGVDQEGKKIELVRQVPTNERQVLLDLVAMIQQGTKSPAGSVRLLDISTLLAEKHAAFKANLGLHLEPIRIFMLRYTQLFRVLPYDIHFTPQSNIRVVTTATLVDGVIFTPKAHSAIPSTFRSPASQRGGDFNSSSQKDLSISPAQPAIIRVVSNVNASELSTETNMLSMGSTRLSLPRTTTAIKGGTEMVGDQPRPLSVGDPGSLSGFGIVCFLESNHGYIVDEKTQELIYFEPVHFGKTSANADLQSLTYFSQRLAFAAVYVGSGKFKVDDAKYQAISVSFPVTDECNNRKSSSASCHEPSAGFDAPVIKNTSGQLKWPSSDDVSIKPVSVETKETGCQTDVDDREILLRLLRRAPHLLEMVRIVRDENRNF